MAEFRYAVEVQDQSLKEYQRFIYGGPEPYDVVPGLSPSQTRVISSRPVDLIRERWNGSNNPDNCTRPATAAEIAALQESIAKRVPLSALDFLRLFAPAERIAIRLAAQANPVLADWYEQFRFAQTVSLEHPDVVAGLAALRDAGLLTSERVAAIMAGKPPEK